MCQFENERLDKITLLPFSNLQIGAFSN